MKKILKRLSILICGCLAIICALSAFASNNDNLSTPIRDVELIKQNVDYQAVLNGFDNAKFSIENTIAKFTGYKTYNLSDFVEIDYASNTQIQEKITVKYEAVYNDLDNSVSLTAIINNGEIIEDTVHGIAFIDANGKPDAVLDFDGVYIFLSELNDVSVIENCGWFKKLVSAAIATVVVTAVVASVLATGGASLGAVVGICALVGAGVGGTTSAIVGAIDWEISFQEVAVNFGAGLVVGAAVGAVTGAVTYKISSLIKGGYKNGTAKYGDTFEKLGEYVKKPDLNINWQKTTSHATQRMAERGMTQSSVDKIIQTGKVLSQNGGEKFLYLSKDGAAVVGKGGELITTYSSANFDQTLIEVLKLLGIL